MGELSMAHENLKSLLIDKPGKSFVMNLTHRVYDWSVKISEQYINYRMFEDVTIREYTGRKNRWGDEDPFHYCFDCVLFIEPGWKALDKRQVYTVGIKLKNNQTELISDEVIDHYIGYTDFFFVGVPTELIPDAINKAYENPDGQIGVFSVDDGKIYMQPQRIHPPLEHERDLLQQIMFNRMFEEDFRNKVSIKVEDVDVIPIIFKDNIGGETTSMHTVVPDANHGNYSQSSPSSAQSEEDSMMTEASSAGLDDYNKENERAVARIKELDRRQKHDAKVAAIRQELETMNGEIASTIVSVLNGLSLNDQRVYHVIRRNCGIQAQNIAEQLPLSDAVEKPSLATIKRSISALTSAGLIERDGSKKTGKYIVKTISNVSDKKLI